MEEETQHQQLEDDNDTPSRVDLSPADAAKPSTDDHSEPTRHLPSMTDAAECEQLLIAQAEAWKAAVQKLLEEYIAWSAELSQILAEAYQRHTTDQPSKTPTTSIRSEHDNDAVSARGREGPRLDRDKLDK